MGRNGTANGERTAALRQADVLERRELGVTGRRRRRERASCLVEALRASGDFGCFIHRISGGLVRGRFS